MSLAKKIFVISTILFSVVLFFWGVYNFVYREGGSLQEKISEVVGPEEGKKVDGKQNKASTEKIRAVTSEAVVSPAIDRNKEKIIYHSSQNGNAVKISFDGQEEDIYSSAEIFGLEKASWSGSSPKAILKIKKDGGYYFDVYDYASNTDREFKGGVDTLVWTNIGDKVLYKYFDASTGKRNLNIANSDGSEWKVLAELNDRSLDISQIPQTSTIAFWNSPNAFEKTSLRTISILGGEVKTIFSEKYGTDYLWSPNGEKLLISSSDSKGSGKMALGIANAGGGEYRNFNIPTMVSKCVWSKNGKYVYYALPNSVPEGEVMPNSYLEKKITTNDTFWKLEVGTGKSERILGLDQMKKSCDASDLFLSPNEKSLYFVNRVDGNKLYVIDL